jgi:hypothetical protein
LSISFNDLTAPLRLKVRFQDRGCAQSRQPEKAGARTSDVLLSMPRHGIALCK